MKLITTSYPRSGSHFLAYSLMSKYDVEIIREQPMFLEVDNKIQAPRIGLIRNPLDSISSVLAMQDRILISQDKDEYLDNEIVSRSISQKRIYMRTIKQISKNADLVIDYESLKNIDQILLIISEKYNLQLTDNPISEKEFYKDVPLWKKESSKNHYRYEYIRNYLLEDNDLIEANDAYFELLKKTLTNPDTIDF